MRWTRQERTNIDDRRAQKARFPGGAKGAAGGIGGIVAVILAIVLGKDYFGAGSGGGGGSPATQGGTQGPTEPAGPLKTSAEEEALVDFLNSALIDMQTTWKQLLGAKYKETTLVLYREGTESGCGYGEAAIGPFYCPADSLVYIDLSFYEMLDRRFGAPGDFAQAYVLGHEVGHHIQNLLGTDDEVRRKSKADERQANALSVKQELQADCYAGVWGHHAAKKKMLESGDVEEGLAAATAIGDDTLQKKAGAKVNPESWTHGSSEQRVAWFRRGFEKGDPAMCDTFATR